MKKQFYSLILSVVFIFLLSLSTAQYVVATPEIGIGLDPVQMSTCPDRVLTANDVDVEIQNLGDATRTFTVKINCNGWVCSSFHEYVNKNLVLMSGEKKTVDILFMTLPANMNPGIYEIEFVVTDVSSLEFATRTLEIEILGCYSVDLKIDNDKQSVCSVDADEIVYDITVENTGQETDTFKLSTPEINWVKFRDIATQNFVTNVILDSGETMDFEMVVTPPELGIGTHEIDVKVASTSNYAQDTEKVWFDIEECYGFSVSIEPEANDACTGRPAEYLLTIQNTGQTEDRYLINAPNWVELQEVDVTVAAGQSVSISLAATPSQEGTTEFEITVNSANDPDSTKSVTASVTSEPCRGASVEVSPAEQSVCGGDTTNYVVKIKNLGTESDTFTLETSHGVLENEVVTISSLETKLVDLVVDTAGITGTETVTVTVKGIDVEKIGTADLIVDECYTTLFTVDPEINTGCACSEVSYTFTVTNTGKNPDTYTLQFEDMVKSFDLEAGETKEVAFDYAVDCELTDVHLLSAALTSEGGVSEAIEIGLNVLAKDACYSVELTRIDGDEVIEVVDGGDAKGKGVVLLLKNNGEFLSDFDVGIEGPDWVYIEPIEASLDTGEEVNLYVYVAPLYGTEAGLYTAKITVDSFNAHAEVELNMNVLSDFVPDETVDVTENESADDSVLEINTSFGDDVTGEVVGGEDAETEEIPFWKTLTIGVITLIIILILLARFILLMRK
ncbi:MAG: hypothetical protein ABIF08_03585 [Nanoarchaeota archaeon]